MAANAIHVSISAETLFTLGGVPITNSMVTSLIATGLIFAFALAVRSQLKRTDKPTGLQNISEFIIESLYNMIYSVTGSEKKTRHFFPIIATFMIFILVNNYLGLLPGMGTIGKLEGKDSHATEIYAETDQHAAAMIPQAVAAEEPGEGAAGESAATGTTEEAATDDKHDGPVFIPYLRAGTADLNMTLALGIVSVLLTQVIGVQYLGFSYFRKFINFSSPIAFFVGILEMISEVAKIISFAFRLFGNIFAGEVLLVVITALTKILGPIPFYGLEVFVGFIQALVFAMLTLVFFNMATESHEAH